MQAVRPAVGMQRKPRREQTPRQRRAGRIALDPRLVFTRHGHLLRHVEADQCHLGATVEYDLCRGRVVVDVELGVPCDITRRLDLFGQLGLSAKGQRRSV